MCAHAHSRTHTPPRTRPHAHARTHTPARTRTCPHMHTPARTRPHAHARTHTPACTRPHTHARTHTHMPACTRPHAHARTHTPARAACDMQNSADRTGREGERGSCTGARGIYRPCSGHRLSEQVAGKGRCRCAATVELRVLQNLAREPFGQPYGALRALYERYSDLQRPVQVRYGRHDDARGSMGSRRGRHTLRWDRACVCAGRLGGRCGALRLLGCRFYFLGLGGGGLAIVLRVGGVAQSTATCRNGSGKQCVSVLPELWHGRRALWWCDECSATCNLPAVALSRGRL